MTDIVERLRNPPAMSVWSSLMDEAAAKIEWLTADRDEWIEHLEAEIERLKEQVATCRDLRKFDRIEIERMRILLDRKTEG